MDDIALLTSLLNEMDVPIRRKELTTANLAWLQRNLQFRNSNHPRFEMTISIISRLLIAKPVSENAKKAQRVKEILEITARGQGDEQLLAEGCKLLEELGQL